ncbi:hypothetical protein GCM10027404_28820 [Arthrobacter tumbae]|uniref:hypothetical protein n=1 Tax=Arthrobacter tumbae TaxID=163874 RepID=UPI00195DB56D|nr:hypothetical protein [Arthrobacter tumbae]MBM7782937.1 hypothetical protein [Arthrobacter tumbae]
MQKYSKLFIIGGALFIAGILLLAPGVSDYSTAVARDTDMRGSTVLFLAGGGALVLASIVLVIRGALLKRKYMNTVQTWESRTDPETTSARPSMFGDRPAWMDRPANHMGDNYGQKRD